MDKLRNSLLNTSVQYIDLNSDLFYSIVAKYIPMIMSHVVSKTSDTVYIGLTALWALIVDAQKVRIEIFDLLYFIFCFLRVKSLFEVAMFYLLFSMLKLNNGTKKIFYVIMLYQMLFNY
jgi:hypothetical protein